MVLETFNVFIFRNMLILKLSAYFCLFFTNIVLVFNRIFGKRVYFHFLFKQKGHLFGKNYLKNFLVFAETRKSSQDKTKTQRKFFTTQKGKTTEIF